MRIIKLSTILVSLAASSAFAGDVSVKLTGGFDFQAGYYKALGNTERQTLTQNDPNKALYTTSFLGVIAENQLDNGFKYGAKIGAETTTKSSRKFQSGIFTESDFGRLELGSEKSAYSKMRINPASVAAGPGVYWDMWLDTNKNKQIPFVSCPVGYLDSKLRKSGMVEYSRKITYYTPEFYGLQVGISYIPDSSNVGYNSLSTAETHSPITGADYDVAVKDGIAAGISYKNSIDDLKFKISFVSETGKAIARQKLPNGKSDPKAPRLPGIKRLNNYTVGTQVDYNNLSFVVSYGDLQKSFMKIDELNKGTEVIGGGVRYKHGKLATSVSHFHSVHRKNTLDATTLGVDYKLAPGILPYAEFTYFDAKGKNVKTPDAKKYYHKGTLTMVGTKVEF